MIDGLIMAHLNFAVLACWFVLVTTYRLKLKNYPNELWDEMMNTIQAQVVVTAMEEDADGDRINVRLLLYSDDAKPADWFCQEEANKEFALENPILFVAFHGLRLSVSLALHNSIRPGIIYLMFETVVQRSLSKTHVISNHAAKLESKCAVYLRSQKIVLKKVFLVIS